MRPCTPLLLLLVARGCPAAVLPHSACCTGGACVALAVRLCQQLVQQQLLRQLQRLRPCDVQRCSQMFHTCSQLVRQLQLRPQAAS